MKGGAYAEEQNQRGTVDERDHYLVWILRPEEKKESGVGSWKNPEPMSDYIRDVLNLKINGNNHKGQCYSWDGR